MNDAISGILKDVWQAAHDCLSESVRTGAWGDAQHSQGMMAGVIAVAKQMGYEIEIKQKQEGNSETSETGNKSKRRPKSTKTRAP